MAMVIGIGATAAMFAEDKDKKEEGEVVIKFADCPAAVQKTLLREAKGAKIEKVDKETDDGKVVYETDVMIDGKNYEITVDAKGLLLAKKLDEEDDEVEVKLADCPAAVQKTLLREADGAKFDKVDKEFKDGHDIYEIDVTIDGKNYEITVTDTGLLIAKQLDEEDEEDEKDKKDAK